MPKMKTRKAIAKRVKVTARGKMLRNRPGSGHLKSRKSPKRLRRFRTRAAVSPAFAKQARRMLGKPQSR
jgi:large subunit ribosomal protein L35